MGRVARVSHAGGLEPDPVAVSEQVDNLLREVDGNMEFGEPSNPNDPTSTTLAGAAGQDASHNGTPGTIAGSWVEVELESMGMSKITCTHNLYLDDPSYTVPVSSQPNCRWLVFGVIHPGTLKDTTVPSSRVVVDVCFLGDTVAANSIQLRFNVTMMGDDITIAPGANAVLVTLFFTKATRGAAEV